MVVLHYTAMPDAGAALARLCDPGAEVSAHYLIDRDGTVAQMVPEELRAWHAGAGRWGRVTDVNSHSIGVELQNSGAEPFAQPQMAALMRLLDGILARHDIAPERVIGHSDMAPARKRDPGPFFDWRGLAGAGLSVWPEPGAPGDFRTDALHFGYDPDLPDDLLLAAFRLRFRPRAQGQRDARDAAMAAALALRWPVDRTPARP
ncbi:MAG: N-acetylmuramoyl-L-alanine amidase [Rubellimicrobium sp.]|nr:N-acetylmuramoyl-L-alanine amidase [Rubellimicrobium sp.]